MPNPDISVVLMSPMVWDKVRISNSIGVGMKNSHNNVFRCFAAFRIRANNMEEKLPARGTVSDQSVEFLITCDAVSAEISPFVPFESIFTAKIGSSWLLSIVP